ncbi:MAG: Rnf-Nqr domain containing protein [Candidatus Edwardsbacteria bacterium]|nr:Rnf-Nqr domain containing protein [Candidatus Edwardsbacteria bacterium]
MNHSLLYALIAGFLLSNPFASFGLIPTSALGATQRPRDARPYAVYGMLSVPLFSLLGWLLHAALVLMRLKAIELPCYILLLWGVNRMLTALVARSRNLSDQAPYFFTNCAVMGAGLLVIARYPDDFLPALAYACGLAASFFGSVILISHFRERIETKSYSRLLAGWPSFLLVCAFLWITFEGLGLLISSSP